MSTRNRIWNEDGLSFQAFNWSESGLAYPVLSLVVAVSIPISNPVGVTLANGIVSEAGSGQLECVKVQPNLAYICVCDSYCVSGELETGVICWVTWVAKV